MRPAALAGTLALAASATAAAELRSFHSPSLGREVEYRIALPSSYSTSETRYPVLYLLHGLFEGPGFWEQRGLAQIHETLVARGEFPETIVVAVDGGNSFFVDGPAGRYATLAARDLVAHVESTYRARPERASRLLLGVSMGGYAALRFALAQPEVFGAVAAHSAMLLEAPPSAAAGASHYHMRAFARAFGDPIDRVLWTAADPLAVAERAAPGGVPPLYFDCGASDRYGLAAGNAALHRTLEARGIAHEFALHPGDHGYAYVRSVLPHSLRFLARALADGRMQARKENR